MFSNDHAAIRFVFEKSSNREQLGNRFQVGYPNIPFFCFILNWLPDDTLPIRLTRSHISKVIIEKKQQDKLFASFDAKRLPNIPGPKFMFVPFAFTFSCPLEKFCSTSLE